MHNHITQPVGCNVNKLKFQSIIFLIYKYVFIFYVISNGRTMNQCGYIQMETDI